MKPMLAATVQSLEQLHYPLMASPKLDGIRAFMYHGALMSRNMKPIPNRLIQDKFERLLMNGIDGELIVGSPTAKDCFQRTTSVVMSHHSEIDQVQFHAFDNYLAEGGFAKRLCTIPTKLMVAHRVVNGPAQAEAFEEECLAAGYEGIMLRDPHGTYKQGRSTLREQGLMKVKRFLDDEGEVVGVEELMHNDNPAFEGELGQTKRTTHKANLRPGGKLGAIVVEWRGQHFRIGTGFTDEQRVQYWKEELFGRKAKFKYLPIGMKDLPRHPVFLGWRNDL